jgi:hypothetical protein
MAKAKSVNTLEPWASSPFEKGGSRGIPLTSISLGTDESPLPPFYKGGKKP